MFHQDKTRNVQSIQYSAIHADFVIECCQICQAMSNPENGAVILLTHPLRIMTTFTPQQFSSDTHISRYLNGKIKMRNPKHICTASACGKYIVNEEKALHGNTVKHTNIRKGSYATFNIKPLGRTKPNTLRNSISGM